MPATQRSRKPPLSLHLYSSNAMNCNNGTFHGKHPYKSKSRAGRSVTTVSPQQGNMYGTVQPGMKIQWRFWVISDVWVPSESNAPIRTWYSPVSFCRVQPWPPPCTSRSRPPQGAPDSPPSCHLLSWGRGRPWLPCLWRTNQRWVLSIVLFRSTNHSSPVSSVDVFVCVLVSVSPQSQPRQVAGSTPHSLYQT